MTSSPAESAPLSVLKRPSWLRTSYEELILAADIGQLSGIDPDTDTALVWFTDWLGWRNWCDRRGHGLHFEHFLADWNVSANARHLLSATEWVYDGDGDMTLFNGISLGKQFNWEVSGAYHAICRLRTSLAAAARAVGAVRLRVRGIRAEYDFLNEEVLQLLVTDVADELGLDVIWEFRQTSPEAISPEFPFRRESPKEPSSRTWLRNLYGIAIDFVFAVTGTLRRSKPRVFLLNNPLIVKELLRTAKNLNVEPVLLAGMLPKSPRFLWRCLADGIRLVHLPAAASTPALHSSVDAIRARIKAHWQTTPARDAHEQATRLFIRDAVLAGNILEERAHESQRFDALFRRLKLARVHVGDSENQSCRTVLEVAENQGIGRDELLNGMFLSAQQIDSRTGDSRRPALVQRLLAWGKNNEMWLEATGSPATAVRTGYPTVDLLRTLPVPPAPGKGNALVLPLHIDRIDVAGLYGEVFAYLVETVIGLNAAGFNNVRVKVHPGFHNMEYYRAALSRHGADCEIIKDGPLMEHIIWSDVVIGPINSGAFVESMAMRRPYYPMRNMPSSLEPSLFAPARVSETVGQLIDALSHGQDGGDDVVLAAIAGWDPDVPAASRVWRATQEACQ